MGAAGWHFGKWRFYHVKGDACGRRGRVLVPQVVIGWKNLWGKQLKRHMQMPVKRTEGSLINCIKWVCRGKLIE